LLRESNSPRELEGYRDHASKIETTFRMGLKGGAHFLGSEDEPINVVKIHFDGHEHHKRHIDRDRIVNRMYDMRDYFHISKRGDLIDDARSDHDDHESGEPLYALHLARDSRRSPSESKRASGTRRLSSVLKCRGVNHEPMKAGRAPRDKA